MDETQLIQYLLNHNSMAIIGKSETLIAAKSLAERGYIVLVGKSVLDDNPIYQFTKLGVQTYSTFKSKLKLGIIEAEKEINDVTLPVAPTRSIRK